MKHIKLFENYMISQKLSGIEDLLESDMIDNILDWGFDFLKKGVSYLMKNELIIELLKNIKPDVLKEGKFVLRIIVFYYSIWLLHDYAVNFQLENYH